MLVIGQCNRTVYASFLQLDNVIGQLKGQFTCHACVNRQNASCARAIVSHIAVLTDVFFMFFFRCLVSFSNFVIVLINW